MGKAYKRPKQAAAMKGRKPWNTGLTKNDHPGLLKMSKSKMGKPAWNKGLTKEDHPSIKSTSEKLKGRPIWCEGLTKETDERLKAISEKMKGKKPSPGSGWNKGLTKETSEGVARQAEAMRHYTHSDESIKKILSSCNARPNNMELAVQDLLDILFPSEYVYVGNGSFRIDGKKPDFVHANGKKRVIEFFGDYWHSQEVTGLPKFISESRRVKRFAKSGYSCLVIWEHELREPETLIRKLGDFNL